MLGPLFKEFVLSGVLGTPHFLVFSRTLHFFVIVSLAWSYIWGRGTGDELQTIPLKHSGVIFFRDAKKDWCLCRGCLFVAVQQRLTNPETLHYKNRLKGTVRIKNVIQKSSN
jgi:hypothetical protein